MCRSPGKSKWMKMTRKFICDPKFVTVGDLEVGKVYEMYSWWYQYTSTLDDPDMYGAWDDYEKTYEGFDRGTHTFYIDLTHHCFRLERFKVAEIREYDIVMVNLDEPYDEIAGEHHIFQIDCDTKEINIGSGGSPSVFPEIFEMWLKDNREHILVKS